VNTASLSEIRALPYELPTTEEVLAISAAIKATCLSMEFSNEKVGWDQNN